MTILHKELYDAIVIAHAKAPKMRDRDVAAAVNYAMSVAVERAYQWCAKCGTHVFSLPSSPHQHKVLD